MTKRRQIVVGIIRDSDNNILLTQRKTGSHLAGYWEFPGGKVELNETPEEALSRELQEEVGIFATAFSHFETLHYDYSDRELTLCFYLVSEWQGIACENEGQNMRWLPQTQLKTDEFPEANREIITRLLGEKQGK